VNIETFIITIQWGKGMHYIASTCKTEKRANELVVFHREQCNKTRIRYKRGAKATVRSWKLIEESK